MIHRRADLIIDHNFKENFRNLKQVFLYITDQCNLRCEHCLYKPNLMFQLRNREIKLETALKLISTFREMGACKLTIMGGEPTMYGNTDGHEPLLKLISEAKSLGYEYIRIDTNGLFDDSLLSKEEFKKLDEITFSLDGHTAEINDPIRGEGTFEKCVPNMRKAIRLGYRVDITACVHKGNIGRDAKGNLLLHDLIEFASSLGANRMNFHPVFKMGVPRDTWIGKTDILPEQWVDARKEIMRNVEHGKYRIPVRIPHRFITREEFEKNPEYYGYCSAKMGERVLIHPNGIIRICAVLIGTPYGVARFCNDRIIWDRSTTNELSKHKFDMCTPCNNQEKDFGNLVPLCISFKAKQDEFIWKEKLDWESRKQAKRVTTLLQLET